MQKEKTHLEPGDIIYRHRNNITTRSRIDRVTDKFAHSVDGHKFRRGLIGGAPYEIGAPKWDAGYWEMDSPDNRARYEYQALQRKVRRAVLTDLPLETLKELDKILSKNKE